MNTPVQYQPSVIRGTRANQIADSVEEAIRAGSLGPGAELPTVRKLAAELGVSPSTVAAAYRELRWRGLAAGSGRRGTRVRAHPPLSSHLPLTAPEGVVDLRTGGPDLDLLPVLPSPGGGTRGYGAPSVSTRLAEVARSKLQEDGIDATNLAVVGGALDGVERVVGAWLRPGDRIAVEDPGYTAALDLLNALGLEVVPVALDDRGARPEELAVALGHGVAAVLLTPRAQNPTGTAWDARRATDLSTVLAAHPAVLVIEDDHAGPAAGAPAFTSCRGRDRWATIRSVSKWLSPDLRLAVMVGDPATVARVEGRQALGNGWVSYLLQHTVAELWTDPAVVRLLDRAASVYAQRREALKDALAARGLQASGTSGLTTWVPVVDEPGVVGGLLERGWAVSPGDRFRIVSAPGIRIACGALDPAQAPQFARALAACIEQRPRRSD
ncbi:MAG TPA: aminotransferase class I/II-fold pyridoxal phosphate-dependent enzyme [Acidimicrobiales bacterium]|nr:aminotransferase class I/II-fold pyridoxal phosphate-dependent enzyme [Acidimicrobiales bacterium]